MDRINSIKESGISTILVMGGSGAYFDHADTVIGLNCYECEDLKKQVDNICQIFPSTRINCQHRRLPKRSRRNLFSQGLSPSLRNRESHIKTRGEDEIHYGTQSIDLSHITQLVDESQLRTIGYMIYYLYRELNSRTMLFDEAIQLCIDACKDSSYHKIHKLPDGDMAEVRGIELACALNRLRSLKIEKA